MEKIRKIEDLLVYQKAMKLFNEFLEQDSEMLNKHYLGRELARQQIRSLDSICANLEEGISRKHGKEFKQFIRISSGSARESKGRYYRSPKFIPAEVINKRTKELDEILAMLYSIAKNIPDN